MIAALADLTLSQSEQIKILEERCEKLEMEREGSKQKPKEELKLRKPRGPSKAKLKKLQDKINKVKEKIERKRKDDIGMDNDSSLNNEESKILRKAKDDIGILKDDGATINGKSNSVPPTKKCR